MRRVPGKRFMYVHSNGNVEYRYPNGTRRQVFEGAPSQASQQAFSAAYGDRRVPGSERLAKSPIEAAVRSSTAQEIKRFRGNGADETVPVLDGFTPYRRKPGP